MAELVAQLLRALDSAPPFALLPLVEDHLGDLVGAHAVRLWLADYEGRYLAQVVNHDVPAQAASARIDEDRQGAAYRTQRIVTDDTGSHPSAFVPVTVRSERLGVLEVTLREPPDADDLLVLEAASIALAYVLVAARLYTDDFELPRRRRDLELPAEMQWELLPILAHSDPDFAVAGWLEPAYDIGGDHFDYNVERQGLTLTITDAMGHQTQAALLSNLAVSALRNARRCYLGLRQQVRAANTAVSDQFGGTVFLTGLFLRVDRETGKVEVVNAGHPQALLLRGGRVEPWAFEPDVPIGLFPDSEYTLQQGRLQPGDRLLLLSDGVTEAAPVDGEEFGEGRVADHLLASAGDPPFEVARQLILEVMEHAGRPLQDDATMICLDYRRGPGS
jgi:serine phosphatase RsbU (regulator of sigma subunit)